jgi:hypothetical protein
VSASPDSLADHPAVAAAAPEPSQDEPLFDQLVSHAAVEAFERLTGGGEDFNDAFDGHRHTAYDDPVGEDFDFEDDQQMRRRLPRLAALYLPGSPA